MVFTALGIEGDELPLSHPDNAKAVGGGNDETARGVFRVKETVEFTKSRMHFQARFQRCQIGLVGGHPGKVFADENTVGVGGAIEGYLAAEFDHPIKGRAVVYFPGEMDPRQVHA